MLNVRFAFLLLSFVLPLALQAGDEQTVVEMKKNGKRSDLLCFSIQGQLTPDMLGRLRDGKSLHVLSPIADGNPYAFVLPVRDMANLGPGRWQLKNGGYLYDASSATGKVKFSLKREAGFYTLYDNVEGVPAGKASISYGGVAITALEQLMQNISSLGARTAGYEKNEVGLGFYFTVKGKNLVCDMVEDGIQYKGKISPNGRLNLKAYLDCQVVNDRPVEQFPAIYKLTAVAIGEGEFVLTAKSYDRYLVEVRPRPGHVVNSVILPDGETAIQPEADYSKLIILKGDSCITGIFGRCQLNLDIFGCGSVAISNPDIDTFNLFSTPNGNRRFLRYVYCGETNENASVHFSLSEDLDCCAVFDSYSFRYVINGPGQIKCERGERDIVNQRLYEGEIAKITLNGLETGRKLPLAMELRKDTVMTCYFERTQYAVLKLLSYQFVPFNGCPSKDLLKDPNYMYFRLNSKGVKVNEIIGNSAYPPYSNPAHSVMFSSNNFYIAMTEMTQRHFSRIFGDRPSAYKGEIRPLESVSYNALRGDGWPNVKEPLAYSYLGRMRARFAGQAFDLPTEAQWETALGKHDYHYNIKGWDGYIHYDQDDNSEALDFRYACTSQDGKGGFSQHTEICSYAPSNYEDYDIHGNVSEWCRDWHGEIKAYEHLFDPEGPTNGTYRCVRGGSWRNQNVYDCSIYNRMSADPNEGYDDIGVRLVVDLPE